MDKAQALRRAQMDVKEVYPHPCAGFRINYSLGGGYSCQS